MKLLRWPYWDAPLAAFVVVMLAAAAITSHGTFVFYSYILPFELAIAATIMLTVGIPLMELAAVLDKDNRWYYVAGMVVLLLMEAAAQYLQGQAHFTDRVRAQFPDPDGVDLATFAAHPAGRLLPILYLAVLSAVVVYFGYAASARVRTLRELHAQRAQEVRDGADLRAALAQEQQEHARTRAAHAQLCATIADDNEHSAQSEQAIAQLRAICAQQEATIAQLQEQSAQPINVHGVDLLMVARRLREAEVPVREIADLLGVAESTLRSRLNKPSTNGVSAQ